MLEVLAHVETIDEVFVAADTQLVDSIGVAQTDQFDLLAHHQHRIENAVLSSQYLTLLEAICLDHFTPERIWRVSDYLFLLRGCESTWVQLLEAV